MKETAPPQQPLELRAERARAIISSRLAAKNKMLKALNILGEDRRSKIQYEYLTDSIENLTDELNLPDEDVALKVLRPDESGQFAEEIDSMIQRIDSGEATLPEIDAQWDRVELLPEQTQTHLDRQLGELAFVTNKFHGFIYPEPKEPQVKKGIGFPSPAIMPRKLRPDLGVKPDKVLPDIPDDDLENAGQAEVSEQYQRAVFVTKQLLQDPSRADLPKLDVPSLDEVKAIIGETGKKTVMKLEIVWKIFGTKAVHPETYWELKQIFRELEDNGEVKFSKTSSKRPRNNRPKNGRIAEKLEEAPVVKSHNGYINHDLESRIKAAKLGSSRGVGKVSGVNHRTARKGGSRKT